MIREAQEIEIGAMAKEDRSLPMVLGTAARVAFPDGSIGKTTLRRLIKQGKLNGEQRAGVFYTTLAAIDEMRAASIKTNGAVTFGVVYVVGYGPYVKIGFTSQSIAERLATLSTGCPEPLVVYFEFRNRPEAFERELHREFQSLRLRGEWFRKTPEMMDRLADLSPDKSPAV